MKVVLPVIGQTPLPFMIQEQEELLTTLENRLTARLGNRVRDLKLELNAQDQLIIKGCAYTYHAKQLAQHAVMKLSDYVIAANDIEVL